MYSLWFLPPPSPSLPLPLPPPPSLPLPPIQICFQRLVGILLMVYVEESLIPFVSDVEADLVPCGIMGHLVSETTPTDTPLAHIIPCVVLSLPG